MKIYTLPVLMLILAVASCKKDNSVQPVSQGTLSSSGTTAAGSTTNANKTDTVKYGVTYKVNGQPVKTSISDSTLTLVYTENVNLILNSADYYSSWAVHLKDDFSKSALANFDYTTINSSGMKTLNWVDDNLNNIVNKSAIDTTINNIKMVRLNVARKYTFFKTYSNSSAAVNAQNSLVARQNDVVTYTANYYMPSGFTKSYTATANIYYTK